MKQTASKEDVEVFRCNRAPYVTHFIFNRHHFDSNYFEAKYDFAKTKYSSEEVLGCPELVDFGVVILCSLFTPGLGDYGHYQKKDWEWCYNVGMSVCDREDLSHEVHQDFKRMRIG